MLCIGANLSVSHKVKGRNRKKLRVFCALVELRGFAVKIFIYVVKFYLVSKRTAGQCAPPRDHLSCL
jgi:hypothetical protein